MVIAFSSLLLPPPCNDFRLSGEHELVTKEFERLPKKEELEQHIKELTKSADELNDEISLVRRLNYHFLRPYYVVFFLAVSRSGALSC